MHFPLSLTRYVNHPWRGLDGDTVDCLFKHKQFGVGSIACQKGRFVEGKPAGMALARRTMKLAGGDTLALKKHI